MRSVLKKSIVIQILYNTVIRLVRNFNECLSGAISKNDDIVLVQAYEGRQYSCNPKYIALYLLENTKRFKIILSVQNTNKFKHLETGRMKLVKSKSLEYYYYFFTAKTIIFNDFKSMYLPYTNKQLFINTWHGGGAYKKVGLSLSKNVYYIQRYIWRHEVTKMISSCHAFSNLAEEAFGISSDKFLNIGMPRNDLFFSKSEIQSLVRQRVHGYYHIPENTKILLYAPTYRESFLGSLYGLDFRKVLDALKEKFGNEWIMMFRGHYFLENSKKVQNSDFLNVSEYDDMQELLCAADCLITDYSSSVWDFSLTFKPCFLYATDLEQYKKDVDFYLPIEKWPFPLAQNNAVLLKNINDYDTVAYQKAVNEHHNKLGSFEHGNACNDLCEYIIKNTVG